MASSFMILTSSVASENLSIWLTIYMRLVLAMISSMGGSSDPLITRLMVITSTSWSSSERCISTNLLRSICVCWICTQVESVSGLPG